MIATYFGLRHMPFTAALAVPYLFPSDGFGEVVARLRYLMETRGLGLLTGEAGVGKSTTLRALAAQCDPGTHPLIYLADSDLQPADFYRDVLEQCGVQPARGRAENRLQFQRLFVDWHRHQGKTPLICIDEAHLLSAVMVQEIRFATNFGLRNPGSPFAMVLIGQPELRSLLRLKSLEAVAQRVTVRFHLAPLDEEHTGRYLHHQLRAAGCDRQVFTDGAARLLHAQTRGIPRILNTIATACLWDVSVRGGQVVEEDHVRRALADAAEI